MNKQLRILVTNDDGIHAPGIKALATALREIATVIVVAPDRDNSGAGHSLTLSRPLSVAKLDDEHYSVQGTPTDCVHLALTGLFDTPFDLIVSGINSGANLGDDVIYSGTVSAALEGRILGFPSIAFSLTGEHRHFDTAAKIARQLVSHFLECKLDKATTLSVNVPDITFEEVTGFEITRLGSRHPAEPTVKQIDPRGRPIYWIGPAGNEKDAGIGTDFHAITQNKVSITPLNIDLTCYRSFNNVAEWLEKKI